MSVMPSSNVKEVQGAQPPARGPSDEPRSEAVQGAPRRRRSGQGAASVIAHLRDMQENAGDTPADSH
jgi:hypothetical protein